MTFALPTNLGPRTITPRLLSNATEPPTGGGGADQRFLTLGSRYAVDVKYPPMKWENASLLIAALLRAEREEVTMAWPQPGFTPGAVGARTVSALTSANATVLPVAGGAVYTARPLQFFNLVGADGRRYLHSVVQQNNIPGNIIIAPALRIEATAGLALDFATPLIQGFVQGRETPWSVDEAHIYGVSFTIKERK